MRIPPPAHYAKKLDSIGQRLRDLRKEAGYTSLDHFCWENKLPRTGYGDMERGSNFRITTLLRVLEIHGITMEEFFKGLK